MQRQLSKLRVMTAPAPRPERNSAGIATLHLSSRDRSYCPRNIRCLSPLGPTTVHLLRCRVYLGRASSIRPHFFPLSPTGHHYRPFPQKIKREIYVFGLIFGRTFPAVSLPCARRDRHCFPPRRI